MVPFQTAISTSAVVAELPVPANWNHCQNPRTRLFPVVKLLRVICGEMNRLFTPVGEFPDRPVHAH